MNEDADNELVQYDEEVVNNLVALEIGTREQCIEASKFAQDYKDPESVVNALHKIFNNESDDEQKMSGRNISKDSPSYVCCVK